MHGRSLGTAAIFILVCFAGCGGCDEKTGPGPAGDAVDGLDGRDGGPADGRVDAAKDDGSGGTGDGTSGVDGVSSQCPGTKTLCSGQCVSTRLHPDHCGSCGRPCPGGKVCNAGQCTDSCPQGMRECSGRCVDVGTNDDHCGDCGQACGSDKGCNHGECTNTVDVGPAPNKCSGGGPAVEIGFGSNQKRNRCTGRVARRTFRWAMCSCDAVRLNNTLRTDGYDSSKGPYQPGGYGGGVGTNGEFRANNKFWIWGALWTSASQGVRAGNVADVKQELHSQGDVVFQNTTDIRGDGYVGGDVTSGGDVEFHKTLYVPQSSTIDGSVTTKQTVRRSVSVSSVCGRCNSKNAIPVKQIVVNHETQNDNGAINLDEDALDRPGEKTVLKLPCGTYYLSKVDVNDETTIVATGHTALFVGGDVRTGNKFIVKPRPGATLDVFIAGDVHLNNTAEVGSPAYAANTRFYVGGSDGWNLNNKVLIGANVYARPGGVHANNVYEQYGGLYTQSLDAGNKVRIHYDREVLDSGKDCPTPDPDPDPDAGMDGGTGMDADAGGGGSTCSQKGEGCSTDSECCSPLVCNDGACEPTGCNTYYESCQKGSDCCSGSCGCSGNTCRCVSG